VRAAFTAAGWTAERVDVQPIGPSLEDVFVLRSEAAGRAA